MQGWGTVNKQEIYHSSRSRNTQRAHSVPLPPPPRAVASSRALTQKKNQPHTEEKPARVDLILTDTEQTPMWGTGQSAALKIEESVAQKPNPVNQDARSHLVPSISLITDIFTVFHSNHLSVKFYLTNIFPSSSGWHVSLSRLKQTLMVICHNEFGFSQNCRGKMVAPLIPEITEAWLLLTEKEAGLEQQYCQSLSF